MNINSNLISVARSWKPKILRSDHANRAVAWLRPVSWVRLAWVSLALVFVIVGAIDLDLGPVEARLGLAAGERAGPVGQVFGYSARTCGRPKSGPVSCSLSSNHWVGLARRSFDGRRHLPGSSPAGC